MKNVTIYPAGHILVGEATVDEVLFVSSHIMAVQSEDELNNKIAMLKTGRLICL